MKTIDEIYQELLAVFSGQSGYFPSASCDLSARLYAVAAQVQALYLQADWVMRQTFPQTAAGEYLDYHAQTRGISRGAATAAEGSIRFMIDTPLQQNLQIPKGTVCMTGNGLRFETVEEAVLEAGKTQTDVAARAMESGRSGNVAAGGIHLMAVAPAGIRRCTNPAAFAGGADREEDESLRVRILDSYRRLPNGANAAFYEQEAVNCPGVAAAKVVGRARGIGTVDVYISTEAGLPDSDLLAAVQAQMQKKREIAVDVQVKSPVAQTVNIAVALEAAEGSTFAQAQQEADAALRAFFTGKLLGEGVTLAQLGYLLYNLPGVANYKISSPAVDVAASVTGLPRLGTLTVTELGGA